MGCVNSKRAVSVAAASPVFDISVSGQPPHALAGLDRSSVVSSKNPSGFLDFQKSVKRDKKDGSSKHRRKNRESKEKNEVGDKGEDQREDVNLKNNSKKIKKRGVSSGSINFKLGFPTRNVGAEQIAAGWPAWLSSAAGEAIHGWIPLRPDAFEKLDKIGQGTYSSVFQAREVETGRLVALKKVRFDNFQPESIRFMAREIVILRMLDHPNIVKLEGIITSRLSCSIYLVFEYMEHDLAGLVSSPDVKFSESQVKCYMKQLLGGIEHCHLRGIMHRDIKASNILVNNEGILKLGDFGLANILNSKNRQQLTSRVVTLWYRPPELLMGSTSYGVSVDLWSVGCVFAELLLGKPILKGRTEVEQLHKIFKLCGSPPEDYWKHSKLPNSSMYKPQLPYESSLREKCQDFPESTIELIETFLSVEPEKRGTASSALMSQYFNTLPYACDPSSLPKYPPNKEMDAKYREEAQRRKAGGRTRESGAARKPRRIHKTLQDQISFSQFSLKEGAEDSTQFFHMINDSRECADEERQFKHRVPTPAFDAISMVSNGTKEDYRFTGPEPVTGSSGFAWAKMQKEDTVSTLSNDPSISSSQCSQLDTLRFNFAGGLLEQQREKNERTEYREATAENVMHRQHNPIDRFDSFNVPKTFCSYDTMAASALRSNQDFDYEREKVEFSGPLLSELYTAEAHLQRNESQIRRAARRSKLDRA